MAKAKHDKLGNCLHEMETYLCESCGIGNTCDVCHYHDEPRGACSECPRCPACEKQSK